MEAMKNMLRILCLTVLALTAAYASTIADVGPTPPEESPGPGPGLILTGPFNETAASQAAPPPIFAPIPEVTLVGTPEPGGLALLGSGLALFGLMRRKA